MRRFLFLICLSFLLRSISLEGQWREPRFSSLGPEEGLHARVNAIIQDSTGFIYFGTNTGLYRYDGNRFEFFGHEASNESSIGTGDVYTLTLTRDGTIWIGLRFGGLNSFNPKTNEFRSYPLPGLPFRSVPSCHSIFEDDEGMLWIGGSHFRLLRFDRGTETFTSYTPPWFEPIASRSRYEVQNIRSNPADKDELLFSVFDYAAPNSPFKKHGWVTFHKHSKVFNAQPCAGKIHTVENNTMWGAGWNSVITKYNLLTEECDTLHFELSIKGKKTNVESLQTLPYQNALLVLTSKALIKVDRATGAHEVLKYANDHLESFICMYEDRDHNLWIGSNQGAYVMNPDDQWIRNFSLEKFGTTARLFPGRLAYDEVHHDIYLVHANDTLSRRMYRISMNSVQDHQADYVPTPFQIHGIAFDCHNQLWIGGNGDFYQYDLASGKFIKTNMIRNEDEPLPWIMNMKSDKTGWVGAHGFSEFIWFHADSQDVRRIRMKDLPGSAYAKSNDNDFDGFSFGQNNVAYLFANEVFELNLVTGKAKKLKLDNQFNPYQMQIQYVGEAKAGDIWLSSFEMIGQFTRQDDSLVVKKIYTIKDGLISPSALELHMDESGRIWTFTNSGINCIDPVSHEVRYFGVKEGLPMAAIDPRQVLTIQGNQLATVCGNGLIVFNTDELWNAGAQAEAPVIINQVRIAGEAFVSTKHVNYLEELYLKPGQKLVDIEFQGLTYPTDYRLHYSYRLKGLHENWISIGQNKFVTLPALNPGEYIFEVKAGNANSPGPVKSLLIHVAKPLVAQSWFIIACVLLVGTAVYLFLKWRIRRIKRTEEARAEIRKKFAELELKALRAQMNPHFMFNSLNSIKNYILQAEQKVAAEYLSSFSHLIRMILQNSGEKSISLKDELETLLLYIELEQMRFDHAFDFECVVKDDLPLEQVKIPPMLLQPFVENAIWHGLMHKKENGQLRLHFARENGSIVCSIEDNGVGRQKAQEMKSFTATRYKSMGMGITRDRIEIINEMESWGISTEIFDKVDVKGEPAGVRVVVRIPVKFDPADTFTS